MPAAVVLSGPRISLQAPLALAALAALLAVLVALRAVARVRPSRAVAAIKGALVVSKDGVSLPSPLRAELGRFRVVAGRGRRRLDARFEPETSVAFGEVSYGDLCSGGYLFAVGPSGAGYLDAPALRVAEGPYKDTLVLCFDPQEVPSVTRSIEISEGPSMVTGVVSSLGGGYSVRMSFAAEAPSWRLVYDPQRGSYRIAREPWDRSRVEEFRVDICVKPPECPECEVCATVVRTAKAGLEIPGRLEGLSGRRIAVVHKSRVDLPGLAEELEIPRLPHISGYVGGYVTVRLTMRMLHGEDVRRDEPV